MVEARRRGLLFALIALLLAGFAAHSFSRRIAAWEAEVGKEVEVLVAAREIPARVPITAEMLTTAKVPTRYASGFATASKEEVLGQATLIPLQKGDWLTRAMVAPMAPVGPGERLITLRSGGNVSVEKGILPGGHADIIATRATAGAGESTEVVLRGVAVVAVEQRDRGYEVQLVVSEQDLLMLITLEQTARQLRVISQEPFL